MVTEPLEDRRVLATLTVTNGFDAGGGSLRDAIAQANANPGEDRIIFSGVDSVDLTSGAITISDSLSINGPGATGLRIDAGGTDRIFTIENPTAEIEVHVQGVTLANGDATQGGSVVFAVGGAISNTEHLTITDSSFKTNHATEGGAIFSGLANAGTVLELNNVEFFDNTADEEGGAIRTAFGELTANESTFQGNQAAFSGAAIDVFSSDVSIQNSTIADNSISTPGGQGGGIRISNFNETVEITNSTFENNSARLGAAIDARGGTVIIEESAVVGNTASQDGGALNATTGIVDIINSTFSGNEADRRGGAIFSTSSTISILHSTIANNVADANNDGDGDGGGVHLTSSASGIVSHSIIADNQLGSGSGQDLVGTFTASFSLLENIASANIVGNDNIFDLDPRLGPLVKNGGATVNHALRPGSPAINAGDPGISIPPATDQRAKTRIMDGVIDIGAVESGNTTTYVVDIAHDESDQNYSPGDLSLREAFELGNSNSGFTIVSFDSDLHGEVITVEDSRIVIATDSLVVSPGPDLITISGQNSTQIFRVTDNDANNFMDVTFEGVTIRDGLPTSSNISGGAIASNEHLTIRDSVLSGNTATSAGGAIRQFAGDLTIANSILEDNSTERYTGGAVSFSGRNLSITDSVVRDNEVATLAGFDSSGGGVFFQSDGELTISSSTVSGNESQGDGGGLFARYASSAEITNSTFADNRTTDSAGDGAGIFLRDSNSVISGTTINDNVADDDGGGLYLFSGTTEVVNSTISGNRANDDAGGIRTVSGATATILYSTIAFNVADSDANSDGLGGGIQTTGTVTLEHSIVANNSQATGGDANGSFDTAFNLISSVADASINNPANNDRIGVDPVLGMLQNNGGPTATHALLAGSAAIDSGSSQLTSGVDGVPESDQRGDGFPRINGTRIDIGAFETQQQNFPDCDFTQNGTCDSADIDFLINDITIGDNASIFDLTGDGLVNLADRDEWLVQAGALNLPSGNPYLLGDANLDGSVDVADFNRWNSNKFTNSNRWSSGDFNADGVVDVGDFNIWNSNKFQSSDQANLDLVQFGGHGDSEEIQEEKENQLLDLIFASVLLL